MADCIRQAYKALDWVVHYLSVENLDVEVLSAIAANLGTVIAGIIKNKKGTVNFDVEKGIIDTYNDTNGSSSSYGAGSTYYMGRTQPEMRHSWLLIIISWSMETEPLEQKHH